MNEKAVEAILFFFLGVENASYPSLYSFLHSSHAGLAIVPIPLLVILTDMFLEVIQVRYFARSVQFAEVYILCQREWIDTILRIFVAEKHWKTILRKILLCPKFLFRVIDNTR